MPSLHVKKTFQYRDQLEEWSNGYHFAGGVPASQADWKALADAVVAAEAALFLPPMEIVGVTGYAADGTPAVFNATYAQAGTAVFGGGQAAPGYNTMNLRYLTDQRTSKGHPIYLRNFYHGCFFGSGESDTLLAAQHTALAHYGTLWVAGFAAGAGTFKRAGPNGAVAQTSTADTWLGHRTLRRRG